MWLLLLIDELCYEGKKRLLAHFLIPVLCIQLYLNFSAKILIDFFVVAGS